MQDVSILIFGAVIALLSSIITLIVQHRLSLRKEYSQRWWERKAEAYTDIIEKLSELHLKCAEYESQMENDELKTDEDELDEEEREKTEQEFWKAYNHAMDSIKRIMAVGSFVVSEDTIRTVANLTYDIHLLHGKEYEIGTGDLIQAVEICINQVREYAKIDLSVK